MILEQGTIPASGQCPGPETVGKNPRGTQGHLTRQQFQKARQQRGEPIRRGAFPDTSS